MKEIIMVYQEMSGDAIKCMLNVWAYLEPSGEAGGGTGRMPVGDRKTSQETLLEVQREDCGGLG